MTVQAEVLQLSVLDFRAYLLLSPYLVSTEVSSISLGFNFRNAISLKWLFADNLSTWAASSHTLLLRQISNFNLGSQVKITDSHQEQGALVWTCSENPHSRGGCSCPSRSLVTYPSSG